MLEQKYLALERLFATLKLIKDAVRLYYPKLRCHVSQHPRHGRAGIQQNLDYS